MHNFKKKPLSLFLFFVGFGQLTACAVPHTRVYVDNSACVKSFANGIIATTSDSWGKEAAYKANPIDFDKRTYEVLYFQLINKELNHFSMTSKGTDYSYIYSYIFQKDNGVCWLKLYKKESSRSSYTNTITFIQSEKLEGCKCGNNDIKTQIGLQ